MGDYISRDMAIARLTKVEVTNRLATMTGAKREIAEMPAADVVPVSELRMLLVTLYEGDNITTTGVFWVNRLIENCRRMELSMPVVLCKDCEKSGITEFGERYCSKPMGAFSGCLPVKDDSFCSGGKRKKDGNG